MSPQAETTYWGRELMWSEDAYDDERAWISRLAVPDPEDAITLAASEMGRKREEIQLRPVLMREQSEVEAKITGYEYPCWVLCTRRARRYEPFWQVEIVEPEAPKGER